MIINDALKSCKCWQGKHYKRIGGKLELKKHLKNLGFIVGGSVTIISALGQ